MTETIEPKDATPEQIKASQKIVAESLKWCHRLINRTKFLLEEINEINKAFGAIELSYQPTENPPPEQVHENNKKIRDGLAWIHFKLQTMAFEPKDFNKALQAKGVLYVICTDLQKKIEIVEPPPVKEATATTEPYVIDATPAQPAVQ